MRRSAGSGCSRAENAACCHWRSVATCRPCCSSTVRPSCLSTTVCVLHRPASPRTSRTCYPGSAATSGPSRSQASLTTLVLRSCSAMTRQPSATPTCGSPSDPRPADMCSTACRTDPRPHDVGKGALRLAPDDAAGIRHGGACQACPAPSGAALRCRRTERRAPLTCGSSPCTSSDLRELVATSLVVPRCLTASCAPDVHQQGHRRRQQGAGAAVLAGAGGGGVAGPTARRGCARQWRKVRAGQPN